MRGRKRILYLDVADYTNKLVCNLYDNQSDISGQAHDVYIEYSRNGWKEVSFVLPSTCQTAEGEEENYRLQYIVADYRLRAVTDDGEDWFIISEESVQHQAFSKDITVTAGHISKLLKNKSLDLEFSDDEGNNVGTADQFLETILAGTDWEPGNVAKFYEDDGETVKVRSMNASVKTGAFRLIEQMCELFEAKPVYRGDKKIDILPMNPFSKLEPGEIPEAVCPGASEDERYLVNSNVIELHYDKSIKNFGRKRNTDNISTRLYAYGAYGDAVSKYCSIQVAKHDEYTYIVPEDYPRETEYCIQDKDGVTRYFSATGLTAGLELNWSMLDPTSRTYVWDSTNRIAYKVYEDTKTHNAVSLTGEYDEYTNYFPFLSDYSYYENVGLLSEEAFQSVAAYQRDMVEYYKNAIKAQDILSETNDLLSMVGVPSSGFLKLDIEKAEPLSGGTGTVLTINWDNYPNGVIYRSDYLEAEKNYFQWHVAQALKENGDPVSGAASIIYVLHYGDPVIKWSSSYLRDIDGRTYTDAEGKVYHDDYDYALSEGDKPKVITLWDDIEIGANDSVYLFCRNAFSGKLGPRFAQDEAALQTLQNQTTYVTEKHPTLFVDADKPAPAIEFTSYGWYYRYKSDDYDTPGTLYFAWAERGDTEWKNVYMQDTVPEVENGAYFLNTRTAVLWHGESGEWVKLDSVPDETTVAKEFGVVFMECRRRDMIYKGLYEEYTHTTEEYLPAGNYAFYSAFGYYWLFTTDQAVPSGNTLKLDTLQGYVYQDEDVSHIISAETYAYNTLIYPEVNNLEGVLFSEGSIYVNDELRNGTNLVTDRSYRSNYIPVWPNEDYDYTLPEGCMVVLYDANRNYLGYIELLESGTFNTATTLIYGDIDPNSFAKFRQTKYIKLVVPKESLDTDIESLYEDYFIHLKDYQEYFFANDKKYRTLSPVVYDGTAEPTGINSLIKQFKYLSDKLYLEDIPRLEEAQEVLNSANHEQAVVLGDILREGWWQDSSYVDGDEQRMYNDALDNLIKLSQPEVSYSFEFLDLYGTNLKEGYTTEELYNVDWPDIKITDAAHLVDPDIKINQWAYIDRLKKCYDQQWKTTIEVNTQLTLMGQHEFKDVLSRIAEVASETKAKQTVYKRAENISQDGTIDAASVQGEINTAEVKVVGAGWKTDDKGNMILESADGLAALKFSGSGLSMANSKNVGGDWNWKPIGNGFGISADSITSGTMRGERIEAGTISANKLMANAGNELDIGSNKALNLFATMDGLKPSGSLKTTDGLIQIVAGSKDAAVPWKKDTTYEAGDDVSYDNKNWVCLKDHRSKNSFEYSKWKEYDGYSPAMINIASGGSINLVAESEDKSKEDPSINVLSGGNINVASGGNVVINAGGKFVVASGNFNIDENGNVSIGGKLEGTSTATVGGWFIGEDHIGDNVDYWKSKVGLQKPSENDDNDICFWAGATGSDPSTATFRVRANGVVEAKTIILTEGGTIEPTSPAGSTISSPFISGGTIDGARIEDSSIEQAAIKDSSYQAGPIKSGDLILGYLFSINATTGAVDIQRGAIKLGEILDADQNVVGHQFSVLNDGTVDINKGTINIANGQFKVEANGKLTSKNAAISNVQIDGNSTISGSLYGNYSGTIQSTSTIMDVWKLDSNARLYSDNGIYFDPRSTSEYSMYIGNSTPANANAYIKHNGDAKVANLDVTGVITATGSNVSTIENLTITGSFVNGSSRKVKQDVQSIEHRDGFDKLNPVSFRYLNSKDKHFGLVYEDTVEYFPEICHEDENGRKGVAYIDMIAVLIKEVQDLRKRVAELERSNNATTT